MDLTKSYYTDKSSLLTPAPQKKRRCNKNGLKNINQAGLGLAGVSDTKQASDRAS